MLLLKSICFPTSLRERCFWIICFYCIWQLDSLSFQSNIFCKIQEFICLQFGLLNTFWIFHVKLD